MNNCGYLPYHKKGNELVQTFPLTESAIEPDTACETAGTGQWTSFAMAYVTCTVLLTLFDQPHETEVLNTVGSNSPLMMATEVPEVGDEAGDTWEMSTKTLNAVSTMTNKSYLDTN